MSRDPILAYELEKRFPTIPWDEPVQIHIVGNKQGWWVCRYCIALHGLHALQIEHTPFAFVSREHAVNHIRDMH